MLSDQRVISVAMAQIVDGLIGEAVKRAGLGGLRFAHPPYGLARNIEPFGAHLRQMLRVQPHGSMR
jgi:hypothetical protein